MTPHSSVTNAREALEPSMRLISTRQADMKESSVMSVAKRYAIALFFESIKLQFTTFCLRVLFNVSFAPSFMLRNQCLISIWKAITHLSLLQHPRLENLHVQNSTKAFEHTNISHLITGIRTRSVPHQQFPMMDQLTFIINFQGPRPYMLV